MSKRSADRTFVGHRLTPEARRALDEWEQGKKGALSEDELFRAHGRTRATIAQEPVERPETRVFDQSGLVYGEPVSDGRTDRQKE